MPIWASENGGESAARERRVGGFVHSTFCQTDREVVAEGAERLQFATDLRADVLSERGSNRRRCHCLSIEALLKPNRC